METTFWTVLTLTVIGGINWGLGGLFGIDAVEIILGGSTLGAQVVHLMIGISAVTLAIMSVSLIAPEGRDRKVNT